MDGHQCAPELCPHHLISPEAVPILCIDSSPNVTDLSHGLIASLIPFLGPQPSTQSHHEVAIPTPFPYQGSIPSPHHQALWNLELVPVLALPVSVFVLPGSHLCTSSSFLF